MPRQTNMTSGIQLPDGCMLEISTDGTTGATFQEVGLMAGGTVVTLNWTKTQIDAGNYKELKKYITDPNVTMAPSNLMTWDSDVILALFPGFMKSTAATAPAVGTDLEFKGTGEQTELTDSVVRITHYTVEVDGTQTDADIDWQFTINHATVDAGASLNFKGANEIDSLDDITVAFTGTPDRANEYKLFKLFKVTA